MGKYAILLSVLLAGRVAHADTKAIEERYDKAFTLRSSGRDAEALEVLREIESVAPSGRSKAQVALAEQALGQWVLAERDLREAFERNDSWVVQRKGVLQSSLAVILEHLGTLELAFTPPSVDLSTIEVVTDGERQDSKDALRLRTGKHELEVRAPGYVTVAREITVTANGLTREAITMIPVEPPAAPIAPIAPPRPSSNPGPNTVPAKRIEPEPHATPWFSWVMFGAGAGALGLSVTSLLVSNGFANAYNDDPLCGRAAKPQTCIDDRSSTGTWRTVALASGLAAGALLVVGGVTLYTSRSTQVGVGPRGLSVTGTF